MSWVRGTATDYLDLSGVLVAAATGNSLQSVDSVAAGGSGYIVGEIITLTGGTFSNAAQLEVLTLSGSAVATVRIYNAGIYTVNPTDPVAQGSTDGSGSGATFNCTFDDNGWTSQWDTDNESVTSVDSVVSGGTGYATDDIITLAGGTYSTVAKLRVTSHTGGVIDTVSIEEAGVYDSTPSDPVAQDVVIPAGGTGATFNLSWVDGEKSVILEGDGSGTDEIYVGWRTLSGSGYYNFELHGMTGFTSGLPMDEQPGVSPGFHDAAVSGDKAGAYMLCHNTGLLYWININSYRIILVIKVGSAYFNAYLGFGNRYGTAAEIPYPMCIAGHTSTPFDPSSQSKLSSGLVDPWSSTTHPDGGPMWVLNADNTWYQIRNANMSATTPSATRDAVVIPAQWPSGVTAAATDPANKFMNIIMSFSNIIPLSGTPINNVEPTPGTTDYYALLPATVVLYDPIIQVLVELDDLFWISSFGSMNTEDRIEVGADVYRVFQNCNRTDAYAFFAIKEA